MRNIFILLGLFLFVSCSKKNDEKSLLSGNGFNQASVNVTDPLPAAPMHVSDFLSTLNPVFTEDFNGTSIDMTKWGYRALNSVRGYATVSDRTISLDGNGNFVIQVIKDPDGKYYVGQLSTDGKYLQRYGYFETRAKMNSSVGPHIAFWLQSNTMGNAANDPYNVGAEIDVFEYHKLTPTSTWHTVHWGGYGATYKKDGVTAPNATINDGNYHVFGLLWTSKGYVFFVDGVEVWRTSSGLSGIAEYMILSTELTGFGGNYAAGTYPDSVVFDYVKTYQFAN